MISFVIVKESEGSEGESEFKGHTPSAPTRDFFLFYMPVRQCACNSGSCTRPAGSVLSIYPEVNNNNYTNCGSGTKQIQS
jgi:hypothetical protein